MPRGVHKVKPAKTVQTDSAPPCSLTARLTRRNTDWMPKPSFLSRNMSETKLVGVVQTQTSAVPDLALRRAQTVDFQSSKLNSSADSIVAANSTDDFTASVRDTEQRDAISATPPTEPTHSVPPITIQVSSSHLTQNDTHEAVLDTIEDDAIEDSLSSTSSLYSKDTLSTYSSDSASIYSSASSVYSSGASIYSSGASMYSFDEEAETYPDPRMLDRLQYQQEGRPI
jgi:hypothetical protein